MKRFQGGLLLVAAGLLACGVIAAYFVSQRITERSFRQFESSQVLESLERVRLLLSEQSSNLTQSTRDYAAWTASYDYMLSGDSAYVEENYLLDSLNNLDVDFVALVATDRHIVLARATPDAMGSTGEVLVEWTGPVRERLLSDPLVLSMLSAAGTREGLVFINDTPYVISAGSILNSNLQGPSRGVLVFARRLGPARMQRLRTLSQAEFKIEPVQPGPAQSRASIDGDRISASMPLLNRDRRPLAVLTIDTRRLLTAQNETLRRLGLFNILGLTLIALSLVLLIFDRLVLRKVNAMVADISRVRESRQGGLRIPSRGDYDLDHIGSELNRLLDEIETTQARLQHDALHDSLTGLGNRQLLFDALSAAQASLLAGSPERFALLLVDLDGFKDINDMHGHLAGDQVLKIIAHRLKQSLREAELAARLGGDEFAMLIHSADSGETDRFACRLMALIGQPLDCEGRRLEVHGSIGILDLDGAHADDDAKTLLRKTDIAMYVAKRDGRNRFRHFSDAMQQQLSERKALERDLQVALEQDALEVWYQPVYNTQENRVTCIEALSRWFHPQRGVIPPSEFVPLAEEMHVLHRLDRSVLTKSCRALRVLRELHPELTLSVNISVLTLMMPDITDFLSKLLGDCDLPGSALLLEVPESALARSERDLREPMATLHALGVRFQVDDFGTGYSSLSRMNSLPLDTVKIDGSFVAQLEGGDEGMCLAIIRLVQHLHLRVIAEGVETSAQRDTLVRLGCNRMQGFFFSRPMAEAELLGALATDTSQS